MDHRGKVSSLDETGFILQNVNGHVRVHCLLGEMLFPFILQVIRRPVVVILSFKNVPMGVSVTCGCFRKDQEIRGLYGHHYRPCAFSQGIWLSKLKGVFEQDNIAYHTLLIMLDWLQEHNTEFLSRYCLSKSTDLKTLSVTSITVD